VSCIGPQNPQLVRLADAIAQRVGQQRFQVWFDSSTRLELKQDQLDISVPNDFISDWIGTHFRKTIQDAAHEVLGGPLHVRFSIVPQLFDRNGQPPTNGHSRPSSAAGPSSATASATPTARPVPRPAPARPAPASPAPARPAPARPADATQRLRHSLDDFIVGPSNHLAFNAASYVAEFPGAQYNPLFIHGACGLGKTHLLQGLCRRFAHHHPSRRWLYLTAEEFTNDYISAVRENKVDAFRRRMRDVELLAIDDVHFFSGKKATQEEFLHTFNAIEAMGRQVVLASDDHPKLVGQLGESLVNRFVSGMVVRIDPPNFQTRTEILRALAHQASLRLDDACISWIARRVTQNVRELGGAVTRIAAHVRLTGRSADLSLVQEALGDLDRQLVQPIRPDRVINVVCGYFGLEPRDLMSGRRQRTVSLARSLAMFLIRRMTKMSYPEIGACMGKRNHSTVICACKRMEEALAGNEKLGWCSSVGDREEEAAELVQRLEDLCRSA